MRVQKIPITPTEAKRNLNALAILSGKATASDFKPPQKRQQSESGIQKALFEWARLLSGKYPELKLMYHIPNGNKRDIVTGYNLKLQGVKSGVPDICLPVAAGRFHGLYLELKSERGRLQESQRTWIENLNKQGYAAYVCYGFDEAKAVIENYLRGGK